MEREISAYTSRAQSSGHGVGHFMDSTYLSPAARPSALAVLDQQMGGADLALSGIRSFARAGASAVVGSHVVLELLGVGA